MIHFSLRQITSPLVKRKLLKKEKIQNLLQNMLQTQQKRDINQSSLPCQSSKGEEKQLKEKIRPGSDTARREYRGNMVIEWLSLAKTL